MQPTYLPWAGYFNLMARVEKFVFLDDVQFARRSWQSRNRILLDGKEHLFTVPVRKNERSVLLRDVEIVEQGFWREDHWKTLVAAYAKAPHGRALLDAIEPCYHAAGLEKLADFTIALISRIAEILKISTTTIRASSLECSGKRSEHLLNICQELGCNRYFSPAGASGYLEQDGFAGHAGVQLNFQDFDPPAYAQRGTSNFLSHLSVVDVIAHLGPEGASEYVRGTWRACI